MNLNTLIFILTQDLRTPLHTYYEYHFNRPRINSKLLNSLKKADIKSLDVKLFIENKDNFKYLKDYQYEILRRCLVILELNIPRSDYDNLLHDSFEDFIPKIKEIIDTKKGEIKLNFHDVKKIPKSIDINEGNLSGILKETLEQVDIKGMYKLYEKERDNGNLSKELDLKRKEILKIDKKIKSSIFKEKCKMLHS